MPTWPFTHPIGDQQRPELDWEPHQLIYDSRTGTLTYRSNSESEWSPPDVGSRSGLFITSAELASVPYTPSWRVPVSTIDEKFLDIDVPGSNAIRINFDGYIFWPWSPDHPRVLQFYELDKVPDSYIYGEVLPKSLTRSLLESDLYAVTFPDRPISLIMVPEQSTIALLMVAIAVVVAFDRRR
jgi:hypothetical protein